MSHAAGGQKPSYSIRTIWGLAKSPEIAIDDESLYALVYRETKKDSLKNLNQTEINKVCFALMKYKDKSSKTQRTDEGGNDDTKAMRKKIYKLTGELGWNNNPARVNGFIKKMFHTERLEWLTRAQCFQLIEALKVMVDREKLSSNGDHNAN